MSLRRMHIEVWGGPNDVHPITVFVAPEFVPKGVHECAAWLMGPRVLSKQIRNRVVTHMGTESTEGWRWMRVSGLY